MFAFSGAHRTGKTTLAKEIAKRLGFHYHDASVSKIMKEFGINAVGDIPLDERIKAQQFLLGKFIEGVVAAPRPAICDRTPLDMIGYMLGEITMHNTAEEFRQPVQDYVDSCIAATEMHFDTILLLRPLPVYKIDDKSPPLNKAYQTMVQYIIEGAAHSSDILNTGVVDSTDFECRAEASSLAFVNRLSEFTEELKSVSVN